MNLKKSKKDKSNLDKEEPKEISNAVITEPSPLISGAGLH